MLVVRNGKLWNQPRHTRHLKIRPKIQIPVEAPPDNKLDHDEEIDDITEKPVAHLPPDNKLEDDEEMVDVTAVEPRRPLESIAPHSSYKRVITGTFQF